MSKNKEVKGSNEVINQIEDIPPNGPVMDAYRKAIEDKDGLRAHHLYQQARGFGKTVSVQSLYNQHFPELFNGKRPYYWGVDPYESNNDGEGVRAAIVRTPVSEYKKTISEKKFREAMKGMWDERYEPTFKQDLADMVLYGDYSGRMRFTEPHKPVVPDILATASVNRDHVQEEEPAPAKTGKNLNNLKDLL